MPSFPIPRQITSAKRHEKSPGKTPYTNVGLLEMSTDPRNVPTRDIYRPDTHHPKKGYTISRNRGSFAMPQIVERDMSSHIYPQSSGWRPMRVCHHPIKGGHKE
ncbi:hypothetical protein CUMW_214750 [Citrus unshiu]|uniref:Uncharacterized protein n=2 Tax=Citrus TaxID=2706 RepID=A0A067EWJ7_CITSI|nr:hypothetical protein CISIN_1g034129mg [Citrus sinensis]GAY62044.1 hypothetical protein CUMW_214750 [Citrus unshiu]